MRKSEVNAFLQYFFTYFLLKKVLSLATTTMTAKAEKSKYMAAKFDRQFTQCRKLSVCKLYSLCVLIANMVLQRSHRFVACGIALNLTLANQVLPTSFSFHVYGDGTWMCACLSLFIRCVCRCRKWCYHVFVRTTNDPLFLFSLLPSFFLFFFLDAVVNVVFSWCSYCCNYSLVLSLSLFTLKSLILGGLDSKCC